MAGFQPSSHHQFCNFKCAYSFLMYNSEFHILQWETSFVWLRSGSRAQCAVLASHEAMTWARASSISVIICKRWVRGLQSEYRFSAGSSQGELASQLPCAFNSTSQGAGEVSPCPVEKQTCSYSWPWDWVCAVCWTATAPFSCLAMRAETGVWVFPLAPRNGVAAGLHWPGEFFSFTRVEICV